MDFDFISTTDLQKNPKKALGKKPVQIILTNNKVSGLLFSADVAKLINDSGLLRQIREELYEINDKQTAAAVKNYRSGKSKPVALADFVKKYDL